MTTSTTTAKVLKALGIFGSVQMITILCSVVRTKLAALWIGPVGVGLITIYNSTMDLLASTAQIGLQQSAVRDLSQNRDTVRGPETVAVVKKLQRLTGVAGMGAVILFSPLISLWAFGDYSHWWAFAVLSVMVLSQSLCNARLSVMRAYERFRDLASASTWTAVAVFVLAVPMFYFFRLDGVVPLLAGGAIMAYVITYVYRDRDIPAVRVSLRQAWRQGRTMLSLGFYMTVSTFVTLLASNVFVIYLNRCYSGDTVGVYQAGFTLVNTYVGMIFTSIAMEYYPRLSASARHLRRMEVIVSHEIKIALWVLMPVVVTFVCTSQLILNILYSSKFDAALPFVFIGATGVFFRAASWCIAYAILARGDGRLYIITETASAAVYLALYIPLYTAWGFTGLGIGYVAWYAAYLGIVYAVYRYRYGLRLRPGIVRLLLLCCLTGALTLTGYYLLGPWWTLLIMLPPTLLALPRGLRGRGSFRRGRQ